MISSVFYNKQRKVNVSDVFELVESEAIGARQGIFLQNLSEQNIFVAFTKQAADEDAGFRIDSGVMFYFDTVSPKNPVYIRAESGSADVIIATTSDE